jgi:hypothetical protein
MMDFKKFLLNSNYIQNINGGKTSTVTTSQLPFASTNFAQRVNTSYNKQNTTKNNHQLTTSNIANGRRFT